MLIVNRYDNAAYFCLLVCLEIVLNSSHSQTRPIPLCTSIITFSSNLNKIYLFALGSSIYNDYRKNERTKKSCSSMPQRRRIVFGLQKVHEYYRKRKTETTGRASNRSIVLDHYYFFKTKTTPLNDKKRQISAPAVNMLCQ